MKLVAAFYGKHQIVVGRWRDQVILLRNLLKLPKVISYDLNFDSAEVTTKAIQDLQNLVGSGVSDHSADVSLVLVDYVTLSDTTTSSDSLVLNLWYMSNLAIESQSTIEVEDIEINTPEARRPEVYETTLWNTPLDLRAPEAVRLNRKETTVSNIDLELNSPNAVLNSISQYDVTDESIGVLAPEAVQISAEGFDISVESENLDITSVDSVEVGEGLSHEVSHVDSEVQTVSPSEVNGLSSSGISGASVSTDTEDVNPVSDISSNSTSSDSTELGQWEYWFEVLDAGDGYKSLYLFKSFDPAPVVVDNTLDLTW